ncbi:MAG: hydrogenase expression/formation C-terminal domain-containing protein [Gammaproteobacteria bacterium]
MAESTLAELEIEVGNIGTHNVIPLLHEIRHALAQLLEEGKETVIDLRSIPLAPGEEAAIEQALGEGEVQAALSALGKSDFRETSYPGVWVATHYNRDDKIVGKFVEITFVPALLRSQSEDMAAGLQRLEARLAAGGCSTVV